MKNQVRTSLLFGVLLFTLSCSSVKKATRSGTVNNWKMNFPQKMEYVEQMPHPDSLYVFIMAGQSNMAGRGFVSPKDTLVNPRILTINQSMEWVYAKEPLHFYEPSMAGLDCGMSFAEALLQSVPEGVSIAMIPCAVGGSAIERWLNDETFREVPLLSNFKAKVAFSQQSGIIKGILWHQGESNAKVDLKPSYESKLDSLLQIFRTTTKQDQLPILIGELGSYASPASKRARWDALNTIIHRVAQKNENIAIVGTKSLTHKGDRLHFSAKAQRKLGKKFAKVYLQLWPVRPKA